MRPPGGAVVATLPRPEDRANDLHVLLRHRPRSISRSNASPAFHAKRHIRVAPAAVPLLVPTATSYVSRSFPVGTRGTRGRGGDASTLIVCRLGASGRWFKSQSPDFTANPSGPSRLGRVVARQPVAPQPVARRSGNAAPSRVCVPSDACLMNQVPSRPKRGWCESVSSMNSTTSRFENSATAPCTSIRCPWGRSMCWGSLTSTRSTVAFAKDLWDVHGGQPRGGCRPCQRTPHTTAAQT